MKRNAYLPFKEARKFARSLNLESQEQWEEYINGDLVDVEPLPDNIPGNPKVAYRRTGFKNYTDWLRAKYMEFANAKEFVKQLHLKTDKEWNSYCKGEIENLAPKPKDLPANPKGTYRKEWAGWNDWLNSTQMREYSFSMDWRPFKEAREFTRALGLNGQIEWRKYCKNDLPGYDPKPRDIPAAPDTVYKDDGYTDVDDWLNSGRKRSAKNKKTWLPYDEAKAFVHKLKLTSYEQWVDYAAGKLEGLEPKPSNIPISPYFVYENDGWNGSQDWLGYTSQTRTVSKKDKEVVVPNPIETIEDAEEQESNKDIKNILTLYNPYYNANVIEQHLEILKQNGEVAFGKVRSKLRDGDNPNQKTLDKIYAKVDENNPMQLFLTDYSSIYVANVIEVVSNTNIEVPTYYEELEVEQWYIFDDLRVVIYKDFELLRDSILANFNAVDFNNSTYALYGNDYIYPMQVTMKKPINYFKKEDKNFKYYINIFKSDEELNMQKTLIDFSFGTKRFYNFTPNTQDNIIAAELEFMQNRDNPLYDFSSVVLKYSKAVEFELYKFMKKLIGFILEKDENLAYFTYKLNGREYNLSNILHEKVNYGTYIYLLRTHQIANAIKEHLYHRALVTYIFNTIPYNIKTVQGIRNESVHGEPASYDDCHELRKEIIGIGKGSILSQLDKFLKNIK